MEKEQELSQGPSQEPTPVVVESPKAPKGKKFMTFGIIGAILVVGAICAGVVLYSQQPKDDATATGVTDFKDSVALIASAKSNLSGTQAEIDIVTSLGGKTNDGYGLYGVAPYRVDSRVFQNYPAQSVGFAFKSDSENAAENYQSIVDFFKVNKAKEIASGVNAPGYISDSPDLVDFVAYASYDTGKQICMAWNVDASQTPVKAHIASLGCADKSSYESAAKALDVFYAAFNAKDENEHDTLVLGSPVLGGGMSGYEYAIVHQELKDAQYEGLYFRTTGSKSWTHLLTTSGVALCDDFVGDDAKKAFDGFECLDDTGAVSTVKSV